METLLHPLHPPVSVIVLPHHSVLFSNRPLFLVIPHIHLSLLPSSTPACSKNVESLLRGETATAEQFLCLQPIACPLIELQLLIKMSESSALWGPEALFNPLRLLLTLALPLHPVSLSPCLTPRLPLTSSILVLSLSGKDGAQPDCILLESSMLQSVLDVTYTPRCMLKCSGCPVRTVISLL